MDTQINTVSPLTDLVLNGDAKKESSLAPFVPQDKMFTLGKEEISTKELGQKCKVTIYLAGKIPKGDEALNNELHWTQHHMDHLRSNLNEFEVALLNPAFKDGDLNDQDAVFGRDMQYVYSSNVIFVDARRACGLGVGAEMMWAKVNNIAVIAWAPKDTYYNKSSMMAKDKYIPPFIHPFVNHLSDQLVENIEEGAEWIKRFMKDPQSVTIKNSKSIHSNMERYNESQLSKNV